MVLAAVVEEKKRKKGRNDRTPVLDPISVSERESPLCLIEHVSVSGFLDPILICDF